MLSEKEKVEDEIHSLEVFWRIEQEGRDMNNDVGTCKFSYMYLDYTIVFFFVTWNHPRHLTILVRIVIYKLINSTFLSR